MNSKYYIPVFLFYFILSTFIANGQSVITMESLLSEMYDLEHLTKYEKYQSVQYSSFDRRSVSPDSRSWFANADGFGNEPIPGFEKILKEPDREGVGEYLICDINVPGAIVRLWTARITGTIKMYLDGKKIYDGNASNFLWNLPKEFGNLDGVDLRGAFRQYDALYFPIPFAKSCRIEWKGNLKDAHFYHIGFRLYDKTVKVKTFQPADLVTYRKEIEQAANMLINPDAMSMNGKTETVNEVIGKKNKKTILRVEGSQAIEQLKIKVNTPNPDIVLRQAILRIYFDRSSIPQVEAPVGDFFGAAPGINPYVSLPLSVAADGSMTSRFIMPFENSASIEIENMSEQDINVDALVTLRPYTWDEEKSLYFRARWRINHGLKSTGNNVVDIPYLLAIGKGNIVGAACYLMNPSNIPTAYGNWWGEGDEKIFIDNNCFPVYFGTGSEDYYNYSWSSSRIFFYPYCGQPRNDGPDTRGFVTNFRWHILDKIPYHSMAAFYMELFSHEVVPGFIYARMIYHYAGRGLLDDHSPITVDDVRAMQMPIWNPISSMGAANFRFINAENIVRGRANTTFEYDPLWAEGKTLVWMPETSGEKINFELNTSQGKKEFRVTFGYMPEAGKVRIYVNDKPLPVGEEGVLDLHDDYRTLSRWHGSGNIDFVDGSNIITFENVSNKNAKIAVDFFWIKDAPNQ